jgi:hypothetical protein
LEENLAVLAEIAVGLAGFSSIVVVFRRGSDSGSWKPEDVARFRIMIEASLVAALFAILPAALRGLGLMNPQLWPIASALLFSLMMFNTVRRRREGRRLPPGSLNRPLNYFILTTSLVVASIQLLNVLGWLVPQGPGPYLFGVTWYTVYAGIMFYRLVTAPIA